MATSPSSQGSSPNAAVVIRERIKQKRLFEARFLFGLLDEDDVPPQERLVLERELNGLLAVVRDLQIQANKYLTEGEYNLARKIHHEMERIAVDAPELEDGKRRAVTAREEAPVPEPAPPPPVKERSQTEQPPPAPKSDLDDILSPLDDLPDIIPETTETETSAEMETAETPDAVEAAPQPAAVGNQTGSSKKKLALLAAAAIPPLVLLGFFLMKGPRPETPPPVVPAQGQGGQTEVAIKPLSVRQSADADTPAGAEEAQPSRITIGELTIEE